MNKVINAYINGIIIIIVAVAVDTAMDYIGLESWSGFLNKAGELGLDTAISETNILSLIFLFIVYPLILGGAVVLAESKSRKPKQST